MTEGQNPQEQQNQQGDESQFSPEAFMGEGIEQPQSQQQQQPEGGQQQQQEAASQQQQQQQSDIQLDEYWAAVKETVGDLNDDIVNTLKAGKDSEGNPLTPQAKLNLLKDFIVDNIMFGGSEENDSFVRDFMVAANSEGFDRRAWIKKHMEAQSYTELPSKDFLVHYYKQYSEQNKLNWSDDQIKHKIESMNQIDADMQAAQLKKQYSTFQQQQIALQNKERIEKMENQIKENLVKVNNNIKTAVQEFISKAQNKKVIGGFEFGEADRTEFINELPAFLEKKIVDLGNGQKIIASQADLIIEQIKAKPEESLNMLPYLFLLHKKKLDGYMSSIIQDKVRKLEGTIDDNPESGLNRGSSQEAAFDPGRYMQG